MTDSRVALRATLPGLGLRPQPATGHWPVATLRFEPVIATASLRARAKRKRPPSLEALIYMVGDDGLEPPTLSL